MWHRPSPATDSWLNKGQDSEDALKPIPPCMGYRIGAEENPFGTGAKDEL